jgi:hypothetical protein
LKRLNALDEFVDQGLNVNQPESSEFDVFSGALIIRYLICWANYYYLYDVTEKSTYYLPPDCPSDVNQEGLVARAWNRLNEAQTHVRIRMQKYVAINEVSQSVFSPHYYLLAHIAFLKAKLMLFFPRLIPLDSELPTDYQSGRERVEASIHWGRLYLIEKARLYAAADGEGEVYSCYASMQCWIYIISAYANQEALNLRPNLGGSEVNFGTLSAENCLEWAKKLRNHAIISYADSGRKYYYQIKEKSGLPYDNLERFGAYFIQTIPAIFEFRGGSESSESQSLNHFLSLDMSLLAIKPDELQSCHLIILRGQFTCSEVIHAICFLPVVCVLCAAMSLMNLARKWHRQRLIGRLNCCMLYGYLI